MKQFFEKITKGVFIYILIVLSSTASYAATYYISPTGNDTSGNGSISSPWFTLNKAWTVIAAGDIIYLRGGTYAFNSQQRLTGKNGTSGNSIKVWAYPNENPILTKSASYTTNGGIHFVGNYFHWKGIEITGYTQISSGLCNGFRVENSSYNTFENLKVHGNGNGMQIANLGYDLHTTGNLVLNSDFYENQDPLTVDKYGNADGLAIEWITHPEDVNTIRGCRFWWNTDDGLDLYHDEGTVIIENCQSFYNGHIPGTFTAAGDGQGFKLGDGITDQRNSKKRVVKNCISVKNRTNGFTPNALYGIIEMYNCAAYLNGNIGIHLSDFNLAHVVKNCISYSNTINTGLSTSGTHITNSWQNGISVSNTDFASLDLSLLLASRQPDGSLPATNFLKLAGTSDMIDAGSDVGIAFSGSRPDLGAYEYTNPTTATTFTFTGPTSGNVNSASANFTVTPNNSYTGTITITPSGTGSTGLTAKVLTFSNSSTAQTFTITPAATGSIVLTPTNNGTLTNPATLTYTSNAVAPGAPTSVVASAGNASASVTFVAPANNGGSAITGYTVTSNPAGGVDSNAGSTSLTHSITGLTNGTTYTFTVKATNSAGTSVASAASNSVTPSAPQATAFTFTGPTSGNVNSASANFTVTPNNSYTGTITITPSGTGSTGLTAKVLTFSNSSMAQTFSITPIATGSITLTPSNSGSLTNPAILTYTANAIVPGAPTSVVATAGNASATVSFVAPTNNGGSAITGYTVTSNPAGGVDSNAGSTSLNHSITGLTNGTTYTFTVKATNSAGTSVASAASNSVIPSAPVALVASAFSLSGPTSGSVNSTSANFTVTPNNLYTGTITITPSGTGSTGLSAKVLTFSNSSTAQTFSITPTAAGSITLTPSNSGSLTNPAILTYTANAVVPGAPTSVVAAAENASASVSFVAPANNGGAAITGYTVTSNPAGGVDSNAGSTSLTHSITGLTNGTTYTFTVKATNSAGTSVASAVSNPVIPSAPVDVTAPVVSGFSIPATSSSLTVSISAFTASDNIGITGYLLTETSSVPSSGVTGWTASAPLSYVFSSAGSKVLYAWVKDAAGNVSASRSAGVTITINQVTEPSSHFKTVWQGENGQNHMNFIVVGASIENTSLSANDEIAVFSGLNCVGTKKLTQTINSADNSTFLSFVASQSDGTNNGFITNDTIMFKIWDNKNQKEMLATAVIYKDDLATWVTSGKFAPGATSVVEVLSFTEYIETIQLIKGYNLLSAYVSPVKPDVSEVLKALRENGNLMKMQDEAGNSYEYLGSLGGWINNIGNIEKTEGYRIRVNSNCTLKVSGRPVALPLDIPLKAGWNFISFPRPDQVDGMAVVQSLIDQNKLIKVLDEAGNSIENWGRNGGWRNDIGNFMPGKAYKVNVSADAVLTIQQSYLKSAAILAKTAKTEYFSTGIEGNGFDHMNINVIGLKEYGISAGDELAAFDGNVCVGTIKITDYHLSSGSASLITSFSTDDNIQNGFKEGNPIQVYVWNKLSGNETKVTVEALKGQLVYEKNASVLVAMKSLSTSNTGLQNEFKIDVFPNPSQGQFTVRFSVMPDAGSRIDVLDISGRRITSRLISETNEVFNLNQLTPGMYLVKSIFGSKESTQKLIINK